MLISSRVRSTLKQAAIDRLPFVVMITYTVLKGWLKIFRFMNCSRPLKRWEARAERVWPRETTITPYPKVTNQLIKSKFSTYFPLNSQQATFIHLSSCYLVSPGPFGLLLVLG